MGETRYAKWILSLANQIRRVHNASTNNNGAQARVLYFVLDNYSERDIFQKDIEDELNIKSAATSAIMKKLEAGGMIVREKVPHDDRVKKIRPTPRAVDLEEEVNREIRDVEDMLASGISEEKLDIFLEVTRKMIENLKIAHEVEEKQ